ncbi:hypothetical protein [Cesiribacter andamanensis]|uniref:Uncharacterized protein n=1 Tax=Cesiribacter andamanensis AMV16 TaxID=1279009 RepID=M7N1Y5_9BACT|nr:hypothetical protein [Cesiribacter andamanensis]EMR01292.1 hypothetical protein ADICEAN_03591 [Cesiribacter andamanensis AMV16]
MNCIIDNTLGKALQRGRKLEAVRRYIRMKYGISIEVDALKKRLQLMKHQLEY